MTVILENGLLSARVHLKGAELFSLRNKANGREYMWSGDPAFWGKTSPVLFPIVGTLKDDTYYYGIEKYSLSRHGFARDLIFGVEKSTNEEAILLGRSTPATMVQYPFSFELRLRYNISDDRLSVTYEVTNTGGDPMHFSLGGHPAFKVPMVDGAAYEDYYLRFAEDKSLSRWPLTSGGLIGKEVHHIELADHKLPLTRELFYHDALVIKQLKSSVVSLASKRDNSGIDFFREDFPYLGIWAARDADFVCIEPWCGIADSVDHDHQLVSKEGIEHLLAGKTWSRTWRVRIH